VDPALEVTVTWGVNVLMLKLFQKNGVFK
jgi:hypothetical protein